jgi:hypothetical protein
MGGALAQAAQGASEVTPGQPSADDREAVTVAVHQPQTQLNAWHCQAALTYTGEHTWQVE